MLLFGLLCSGGPVVCFRVGEMYAIAHANCSAAVTPIPLREVPPHLSRTEHHQSPLMPSPARIRLESLLRSFQLLICASHTVLSARTFIPCLLRTNTSEMPKLRAPPHHAYDVLSFCDTPNTCAHGILEDGLSFTRACL